VGDLKSLSKSITESRIHFIELIPIIISSFRIDPTIRHSFWTLVVGGTIFWVNVNGLNQNMIQRYLALKDVKTARKGQVIYVIGVSFMVILCCYNGLLLFATYHDCDPLSTKLAKAKDQMMPLLVMEILKDVPGLPGLFIAVSLSSILFVRFYLKSIQFYDYSLYDTFLLLTNNNSETQTFLISRAFFQRL
jgi:uncharacterized sodium:solute symporter family permease YidK